MKKLFLSLTATILLGSGAMGAANVTDVITDPTGTPKSYTKESAGTAVLNGRVIMYEDLFPVVIYWNEDNSVYISNLVSVYPEESYVKGTVEGNKIILPLNQTVEYIPSDGYGVNVGLFKSVPKIQNGQEVIDFEYAPEFDSVEFEIKEDGNIDLILPGEPFDGENPTQYVLAYYYSDTLNFTGFCDFMQKYTVFDHELITVPDGVELLPYVYIDSYDYAQIVEVGFSDEYLYIKGLSDQLPEAVIRGKIDGNKAIVAQNEYLGVYFDQFYIFTKVLYANEDYDEEDENSIPYYFAPSDVGFELNFDKEQGRVWADKEGVFLSYHCDENDFTNTLGYYSEFELKYQSSMKGKPSNPTNIEYSTQWADMQGWNDLFFTLSNFSTEGNLIDTNGLYYTVYINGEPLVFYEQELWNLNNEIVLAYMMVPMEVILMPYHFDNNEDIFKFTDNQFDIGIYRNDVKTVGVQTAYLYEKEMTYSDIVTLDVETGEITVTPSDTGVEMTQSDETFSTEYYTIDGRRVSNPGRGIFLKRETSRNGMVKTTKIIR